MQISLDNIQVGKQYRTKSVSTRDLNRSIIDSIVAEHFHTAAVDFVDTAVAVAVDVVVAAAAEAVAEVGIAEVDIQ
jgi:hypothetical protein